MKSLHVPLSKSRWFCYAAFAVMLFANSTQAQLVAYDDAGNYQVEANWTNGSNRGFGFTPWVILTNITGAPEFHGNYVTAAAVTPPFANASLTNVLGTNYVNVWGIYANGTNGYNETTAYRGFINPLGTNTFKIQWGAKGAGATLTPLGTLHGYCGFTLRNGNATNSSGDFAAGARFTLYFLDGASPSTLYITDGLGDHSVPGTSFSDLGRNNITNAVQAEVTVGADGDSYHLTLKDCVANRTLYTLDSTLAGAGTIDSAALFCQETTGDQVYNRMQISAPHIPPTIVNLQPTNGSMYLDANTTSISFELSSFASALTSNLVSLTLNGVTQSNLTFNTTSTTNHLYVDCPTAIAPNTFYTLRIIAQDTNGDATTNTSTFNTFLADNLYIDAYDYNYNAGQFINALTPSNSYAGLFGSNTIDYLETDLAGTNNLYRPGDLPQVIFLNTDATGDPLDHANLRQNGYTAYNIGFTVAGEWQNYTRSVPVATNYSIYARAASGGSGQFEIARLANPTATTTNQPLAALGQVNVPNTGGSRVYSAQLMPLTDVFGNAVILPLSGTNTIRCTALSNQGYNLEYLVVIPVTNATGTLRPYIATGSPVPNATAVNVSSKIVFSIANRQTMVNTNTIKLFLNSTSMPIVISSNAAGSLVTFTPTASLPSNATNTVGISFTDSTGGNVTNFWTFVTSSLGGVPGNGLWSGAGLFDQFWSTAGNWSGGVPGPGFNAVFASLGATNNLATNNIVATNVTVQGLFYNTNNLGYHTTWIKDGVTLTVTNGSTGINPLVQVGGGVNSDNVFNTPVTNTITGSGGTLFVSGNSQGSGLANQLNFQVRQSASPAAPEQTVLDMSGLGTMIATVGKFYVAQGGAGAGQGGVSGRVNLARTNIITCLRPNAGQFEVGDSSGGTVTLAGSTLNLGITNALFVDTARIGKQKATNNLVRFNPAFTSSMIPSAFIRGTNGLTSRVTTWTIADADVEATVPVFVSAHVDFSGGRLDAMIGTMIVGRGATTAGDSGFAQGTLTIPAGTLDVNNLQIGVQRAVNTATETGIVNVIGSATLISTNILLAQTNVGATASLVTGNLNVTNGTVRGNIVAGGGNSVVNLNAGTLVVSNNVGANTAPISALNLVSAALHVKADGNLTTPIISATSVTASGTTIITIDSVVNVVGTKTNHLISYTGATPFAGLSLAPLPSGYVGNLVDTGSNISLVLNVSATPPSPSISNITLTGGQIIFSGTNNNGAGGTYSVLASTNVSLPLSNWTVLGGGNFNGSGNFAFTNGPATNSQQFYILRVP